MSLRKVISRLVRHGYKLEFSKSDRIASAIEIKVTKSIMQGKLQEKVTITTEAVETAAINLITEVLEEGERKLRALEYKLTHE